jgi:RNA-directed DNA polymerase
LIGRFRDRIKDKRVCALVKAFLKSGVLTELGDREQTLTGTPQGGILSPLLANIAVAIQQASACYCWLRGSCGSRFGWLACGRGGMVACCAR